MYITDFEYAGERLSDYGLVVCNITNSPEELVSIGNVLTFNTIKNNGSNINKIISTQYDEVYSATIEVGKFGCNQSDYKINEIELAHLMRWLNRKEYFIFKPIGRNGEYSGTYVYATFNVQAIRITGNIVGLSLSLTTNAPFGYYDEIEYNFEITEANEEFIIYDSSDEIGYGYPSLVTITCNEDGDIKLYNSVENRYTTIKNCVTGEIITLDCINKIITSSKSHDKLYNDFNYNFLRLVNTYDNNENIFTSETKCNIDIKYSPICKAGVIL